MMGVGTSTREEKYKRMGLSKDEVTKVKSDVYSVIKLVADSYDIDLDKKSMPDIDIVPGESSSYSRSRNLIKVAQEKINSGESYAAEAGHFLRDYVEGDIHKEDCDDVEELRVQEFFDRAAYIIARKKSKGTKLEQLFKGEHVDYSSPEGRKKLAEMGMKARKDYKERYKELKEEHGEDPSRLEWKASAIKGEVTHFKTHVAYAFADQYSAEELLEIEDLYSLPDNEVRERFLHKKRSGLEEIVSAVFYISLPIFLIYFIFNLNITGFSIVNALNKSLILNPFAIAFIILFVVFVYFKIRKRN